MLQFVIALRYFFFCSLLLLHSYVIYLLVKDGFTVTAFETAGLSDSRPNNMSQIGRLCGIQKKREQENGDERCGGRGGRKRGGGRGVCGWKRFLVNQHSIQEGHWNGSLV